MPPKTPAAVLVAVMALAAAGGAWWAGEAGEGGGPGGDGGGPCGGAAVWHCAAAPTNRLSCAAAHHCSSQLSTGLVLHRAEREDAVRRWQRCAGRRAPSGGAAAAGRPAHSRLRPATQQAAPCIPICTFARTPCRPDAGQGVRAGRPAELQSGVPALLRTLAGSWMLLTMAASSCWCALGKGEEQRASSGGQVVYLPTTAPAWCRRAERGAQQLRAAAGVQRDLLRDGRHSWTALWTSTRGSGSWRMWRGIQRASSACVRAPAPPAAPPTSACSAPALRHPRCACLAPPTRPRRCCGRSPPLWMPCAPHSPGPTVRSAGMHVAACTAPCCRC